MHLLFCYAQSCLVLSHFLSVCLTVTLCFNILFYSQAVRLKNLSMGFNPSPIEERERDRGKDRGKDRDNMDNRDSVSTSTGVSTGTGARMSDLPPVRESIRNLRSEKARYNSINCCSERIKLFLTTLYCTTVFMNDVCNASTVILFFSFFSFFWINGANSIYFVFILNFFAGKYWIRFEQLKDKDSDVM